MNDKSIRLIAMQIIEMESNGFNPKHIGSIDMGLYWIKLDQFKKIIRSGIRIRKFPIGIVLNYIKINRETRRASKNSGNTCSFIR